MQKFKHESDIDISHNHAHIVAMANASSPDRCREMAKASLKEMAKSCGPEVAPEDWFYQEFDHVALSYASAILVSSLINMNDDIFLPSELLKSYHSIANQPLNMMHNQKDIIGHVINSRTVSLDTNVPFSPPEDGSVEFNIECTVAMYKFLFPEVISKVEEEILNQTGHVSMECLFDDFDYGIIEDNGDISIVDRNDETSLLTRYLRSYGGNGTFQGKRIGRVLRSYQFIGVGHIDSASRPANKLSIYTSLRGRKIEKISSAEYSAKLNQCINNVKGDVETVYLKLKGKIMEIKTLEDAMAVITEQLAKISELETQIVKEKADITVASEKLSAIETSKAELETAVNKAKEELATKTAALDALTKELEGIKRAEVGKARIDELKALGKVFKDEKESTEKYAQMSDEAYAEILDYVTANKTVSTSDALDSAVPAETDVETAAAGLVADTDAKKERIASALKKLINKTKNEKK
jgi:hypothetical protein